MDQYRKTPRAQFLDYNVGDFFITICTKGRKHYFGRIYDSRMHLSEVGLFLQEQLISATKFRRDIDILLFVIMPNHFHAIVRVTCEDIPRSCIEGIIKQRSPNPSFRFNPSYQKYVARLSRYMSSLKGSVTKYAKSIDVDFGWQPRYNDHFIRGAKDGNRIAEYILNNVAKWQNDCFYNEKDPTNEPGTSHT